MMSPGRNISSNPGALNPESVGVADFIPSLAGCPAWAKIKRSSCARSTRLALVDPEQWSLLQSLNKIVLGSAIAITIEFEFWCNSVLQNSIFLSQVEEGMSYHPTLVNPQNDGHEHVGIIFAPNVAAKADWSSAAIDLGECLMHGHCRNNHSWSESS
jgi:hypothetical protein